MNCSLYTTLYTSIHDRNSSLSGVSGARVTCIESNSSQYSTVQSDGSVHGQPRIEPRPLPSSPSVLTNTLTCTVRLYCNCSCSLNKKYRQLGELAFQVSIFERELHACMRDLVQTSAREGTFQKREFPAILDITYIRRFSHACACAGRLRGAVGAPFRSNL